MTKVREQTSFLRKIGDTVVDNELKRDDIMMEDLRGRTGSQRKNNIVEPFGKTIVNENRSMIILMDYVNLKIYTVHVDRNDKRIKVNNRIRNNQRGHKNRIKSYSSNESNNL